MAKHTRKGRNPGQVDDWLDKLGYYRKNIAYDETCLFRAVSEQVYACQLFHENIRKACLIYGRENRSEFRYFMPDDSDWDIYLDRLSKHMAVCGNLEVQIISKTFKKRIIIFDGMNRVTKEVTCGDYDEELLLCHMGEDHYDAVYKRKYIQDAGFCQSLIYGALYESVFNIQNVPNIVQAMLYQKTTSSPVEFIGDLSNKDKIKAVEEEDIKDLNDYDYMLKTNIAPFPFKVAKALDPTIYRNIEYDTWTEIRKEMRLGDWYYGDTNFIEGSGCIVKVNGQDLHCYIQKINKDEATCTIYITKRAEKRTVHLTELHPENDAKPWPLPYRFSKNLIVSVPKVESEKKSLRKRRDKKASSNKGSNDSGSQTDNADGMVCAYEGAPLHMHSDTNGYDQENSAETSQCQVSYSETNWEVMQTTEQTAWSQAPAASQEEYSPKLAIPTPEIYTDQRFYYPESYPQYNVWTNGDFVSPLPINTQLVSPLPVAIPHSPDVFNYYYSDSGYQQQYYNTPATPNQHVDMYPPPMFTAPPPGTPIILTPAEVTEVIMPTPPPHMTLYSPAMDMPFVSTPPYIYPPTPPAAWYHPGVNSQGFIFPTTCNDQSTSK